DANGNIQYKGFAPEAHNVGVRFIVTATGQSSGLRAQTTFTDAGESGDVAAIVLAHPNDWEIFASDRIVPILQSGATVVFVYTTSAADATDFDRGLLKEAGTRAAVDLAVPGGTWTCAPQTVGTHSIQRCTKGKIAQYYLRLLPVSWLENLS